MAVYSAIFGDPFVVNTTQTDRQRDAEIATLSNGGYVVVWNGPGQDDPAAFSDGIFGRVFGPGGQPLGDEFQINVVTDNFQRAPQVVAGASGGFTVFWESFVADNRGGIVARSFQSDGSGGGGEFAVNTTENSIQRSVTAAVLNNGAIAAAWESQAQDGDSGGIAVRITGAGGGGDDDFIVNTTTALGQYSPSIAALADGSFVVSWTGDLPRTGTTPQAEIFAQRVSAGGALIGDEILVNTDSSGGQTSGDVAALAGGGFVITWQSAFLSNRSINAQLFDSNGARIGEEVLVNSHGSPVISAPSVIGTPDGGYLISWRSGGVHTDPDLPGGHYAQRYDSTGNRVGEEFSISTGVDGSSAQARLGITDGGDIIATWQHGGSGDTSGGIRGQLIITAGEVVGTGERDLLRGAHLDDRIDGLGGDDTLNGFDGTDTLIGGDGHDVINGGFSVNDLRDLVFGGAGDDSIDGGYGNDELRGDAGNDSISGGFGADTVLGGTGNDTLTGAAFGDLMFGGDGVDFINGGFGSDRVNGGAGADTFFHLGNAGHGSDWIQDFNGAEDVLVYGGNATRDQFQINTANTANAGDAGTSESFVIYRPTGQILWALVDGDAQGVINMRLGAEVFDLTLDL